MGFANSEIMAGKSTSVRCQRAPCFILVPAVALFLMFFVGETMKVPQLSEQYKSYAQNVVGWERRPLATRRSHPQETNFTAMAAQLSASGHLTNALKMYDAAISVVDTEKEMKSLQVDRDLVQQKVSKMKKTRIAPYVERAQNETLKGHFIRALDLYDQAIKKDPDDQDLRMDREKVVLQKVLHDRSRPDVIAWKRMGDNESSLRHFVRAVQLYDKALQKDPDDEELRALRFSTLRKIGQKIENPATVRRARSEAAPFILLAENETANGHFGRAIQLYDKALQKIPGDEAVQAARNATLNKIFELQAQRINAEKRIMMPISSAAAAARDEFLRTGSLTHGRDSNTRSSGSSPPTSPTPPRPRKLVRNQITMRVSPTRGNFQRMEASANSHHSRISPITASGSQEAMPPSHQD
eukprot:SAG31_NODE_6024_length_2204_cov_19.549169_1_plen_412_part_00